MPARRKRITRVPKKRKFRKNYLYILLLIISLVIGLFIILRVNKWNGKNKLSIVVRNQDNSLSVVVFDPELEEIYRLNIPGNTEIEVAGELGIWKIKSLWGLGKQEGLVGKLAARSITTGMKIPIYAWADINALGLTEPSIKSFWGTVFSLYESDLSLGDKLRLFMFSMKVKNTKRISMDLGNTSFLDKGILSDGEKGFAVSKTYPREILAIFSEPALSDGVTWVSIVDSSKSNDSAGNVGSVIEVLGGKISSIETRDEYGGVCMLSAKNESLLKVILKIFECEEFGIQEDQPFDVKIVIGEQFPSKY